MAPSGSEQVIHPESRDYSGFDPFRPEISLVRTGAPGEPLSGLGANTTHRVGGGLWAAGADKNSHVRDENRPEGRLFGSWGQMRLIAVGADELPCSE